jgi:hypothetical protein
MQQPVGEDMATLGNETRRSSGIASVVQTNQRASGGTIFSSPVTSATDGAPLSRTILS